MVTLTDDAQRRAREAIGHRVETAYLILGHYDSLTSADRWRVVTLAVLGSANVPTLARYTGLSESGARAGYKILAQCGIGVVVDGKGYRTMTYEEWKLSIVDE